MKEKIFSVVLLFTVIFTVTFNTYMLTKTIDKIIKDANELDLDSENAEKEANNVYSSYKNKEMLMSLSVSHDDLTNIEDCFVEMIASLSVSDTDGAKIAKSRLINSLEHLRRLSSFNIDSII